GGPPRGEGAEVDREDQARTPALRFSAGLALAFGRHLRGHNREDVAQSRWSHTRCNSSLTNWTHSGHPRTAAISARTCSFLPSRRLAVGRLHGTPPPLARAGRPGRRSGG